MSGFLVNVLNSVPVLGAFLSNGFRPPQWTQPQLTSITANLPGLPATSVTTSSVDQFGNVISSPSTSSQAATTTPTTYFFDAILRVDHFQELRATDHPVQGGASITDHAYLMPARVSLEIGMSDAMDSYQSGQWTGSSSKSINAYQTLLQLQALRIPVTVTTRLNTYSNMIIESIRSGDDARTLHGLKAHVQFRQIIVGTVTTSTESARPHATGLFSLGLVQPLPPTSGAEQAGQNLANKALNSLGVN
jgi:hypothetical protein